MTGPTGEEGVSVPVDGALQAAFVGGLSSALLSAVQHPKSFVTCCCTLQRSL